MLNLLNLEMPILEQLHLEEALLRADHRNYCLINTGSPAAVVMGISAKPSQVVDVERLKAKNIPLIRRYSGGGTVLIEPTTILVTLILNHDKIRAKPFPKDVLAWSEELYKPVFDELPFSLRENDYTLGEKKCGGNAQYFAKGRIVHHTSFVFDYSEEMMSLLLMPPKMPEYRKERSHGAFLQPLKTYFSSEKAFIQHLIKVWSARFPLQDSKLSEALEVMALPHRRATVTL